jgi:hypothetical protein
MTIIVILGPLRPYPQTPKRIVPPNIARPDYADHPEGYPLGEQSVRGSSQIKVLDDEEIEAMKVVCKVMTTQISCGNSHNITAIFFSWDEKY